MKPIPRTAATIRRGQFIRSRFIRSLKEKTAEQMDGGLNCPPSCSRSRRLKRDQNRWEWMGTDEATRREYPQPEQLPRHLIPTPTTGTPTEIQDYAYYLEFILIATCYLMFDT